MKRIQRLIICGLLYSLPIAAQAEDVKAPDACALITKAEIEKAFGELKEPPKADVGLQQEKECHFTNKNGNYVVLRLYTAERWDLQKGINSEMHPTAVPGLGEEAFYVSKSGNKEMFVRKGAWILEIDGSTDIDILKTIAATAIARVE